MNNNQYENFKQGIKTDINNGISQFILGGGLFLLVISMLTALYVAIKDDRMNSSLRILLGFGTLMLAGVMITNKRVLNLILAGWIILILAAIFLPILYIIGSLFYNMFKEPYNSN